MAAIPLALVVERIERRDFGTAGGTLDLAFEDRCLHGNILSGGLTLRFHGLSLLAVTLQLPFAGFVHPIFSFIHQPLGW